MVTESDVDQAFKRVHALWTKVHDCRLGIDVTLRAADDAWLGVMDLSTDNNASLDQMVATGMAFQRYTEILADYHAAVDRFRILRNRYNLVH